MTQQLSKNIHSAILPARSRIVVENPVLDKTNTLQSLTDDILKEVEERDHQEKTASDAKPELVTSIGKKLKDFHLD